MNQRKIDLKFPLKVRETELEVEVELVEMREPALSRGKGTYYKCGNCETIGYQEALASVQGTLERLVDLQRDYVVKTISPEQLREVTVELRSLAEFLARYVVVTGVRGPGPDHADQDLGVEEEIYDLGQVVRQKAQEILAAMGQTPEQMLELICQQLTKVSNDRADRRQEANITDEEMVIYTWHDSYAYDTYKSEIVEETVHLPKALLLQIINEAWEKGNSEATLEGQRHYLHDYSDDMGGGGIDVLEEYNGRAEVNISLRINEGKPSFKYYVTRRVDQTTAGEENPGSVS